MDGDFFGSIGAGEILVGDSFDVGVDFAVEHVDDAGGVGGEGGIVSDHNDGVAEGVNVAEFFHDDMGGARVEVAGGLVSKDDGGIGNKGTANSDALLLATGELPGHVIFAFLEMKMIEDIAGHFETTGFVKPRVDEGKGDVFDDG